jgi:hypothetical protein
VAGGSGSVGTAQPASKASIGAARRACRRHWRQNAHMWLFVVEALAALALLVFIVWWTMFSGRRKGERDTRDDPPPR